MSRSPGWIHSTVIVALAAHEPHFADQFGHDDDRKARDQSVERSPGGKALEGKMMVAAIEDQRQNDLGQGDHRQDDIEAAPEAGDTIAVTALVQLFESVRSQIAA